MLLLAGTAAVVALGLAVVVALVLTPDTGPTGVERSLELARGGGVVAERLTVEEPSTSVWDNPTVQRLVRLGKRITPAGTPERLQHRADLAGNAFPWTVETQFAWKAGGTLTLGSLGLLRLATATSTLTGGLGVALIVAGYWLPDVLLYNAGIKRQETMRRAAPDALDMLTVCVEAGLGFDAALSQVAENTSGPLSAEFARVLREMRLGRSRGEAFAEMAERSDVGEIKSFVAALVQADRLGVPVGGVLREQAAELRVRRRQLAEEKAQKVPVKILFPVLLCIFPVFFIIIIGPGAIRVIQSFSGNG